MSETVAAPPKDAESYLLEGEEDETEVRFSFRGRDLSIISRLSLGK